VAIQTQGTTGAVVEVNSETDFVARNEAFQSLVHQIAQNALNVDTVDALASSDIGGKVVSEALTDLIAKIGENMSLRRMNVLSVSKGCVVGYVHSALAPNLGKIGVLVALESTASADVLEPLGKQIAMHVAAANPQALSIDDVDASVLDRERSVLKEQAMASGKPPEIAEKMVEGRIRKFYQEICLTEQTFIMDNETKIADVVANAAKDAGSEIKLTGFVRVQLGEGIEKEQADFAAEVAAAANG
jgi:elongation factor Ts